MGDPFSSESMSVETFKRFTKRHLSKFNDTSVNIAIASLFQYEMSLKGMRISSEK